MGTGGRQTQIHQKVTERDGLESRGEFGKGLRGPQERTFSGRPHRASAGSGWKQSRALRSRRSSQSPGREQRTCGHRVDGRGWGRSCPGHVLYLPVAVTQSYNPLIPDLGVLVNGLAFFVNIDRLCLKDRRFQRLARRKRQSGVKPAPRRRVEHHTLIRTPCITVTGAGTPSAH